MKALIIVSLVAVNFSCFAQQNPGAVPLGSTGAQSAITCDCTSYPFKPNPPCFGSCVERLSSTPNPDLSGVTGLDPGVAVSIRVLAANPRRQAIDFSSVREKSDLEIAADKSLRGTDLRGYRVVPRTQLQRER